MLPLGSLALSDSMTRHRDSWCRKKHHHYRVFPQSSHSSCSPTRLRRIHGETFNFNCKAYPTFCFHLLLSNMKAQGAYWLFLLTIRSIILLGWETFDFEEPVNWFGRSVRSELRITSSYDSAAVCVNYAYGDETLTDRYGAKKLDRLIGLKEKWDPKNLLGFNNALPTS